MEQYRNETADTEKDTCCLLSPGEKPIPGGLLPSRAHFRIGSQCKIHYNKLYLQPAKISYHFQNFNIIETKRVLSHARGTGFIPVGNSAHWKKFSEFARRGLYRKAINLLSKYLKL